MKPLGVCLLAVTVAGTGCTDGSAPMSPTRSAAMTRVHSPAQPNDLVATPHGWYHSDCVVEVPDGAHVNSHNWRVTRVDGSAFQIRLCSQPGRVATGRRTPSEASVGNTPEDSGFVAYGGFTNGGAWGKISASWRVPTAPTATFSAVNDSDQTLYIFPGLEPTSGASILQPVLTYGIGGPIGQTYGGNFWSATSWYCGAVCAHSSTVLTVSAGDSLVGSVVASDCANGDCEWTVTTTDATTGHTSTMVVQDSAAYTEAFGGVMEAHHLLVCQDYPANGVVFKGISLFDQSNHQATPSWIQYVQAGLSPRCGLAVSSTPTAVTIADDGGPSVSVTGPETGSSGQRVTVTATASGGVPPYSYAWRIVGGSGSCGNTSTCSANLGAGGGATNFFVTLTDADLATAAAEWTVNTCANGVVLSAASVGQPRASARKC
jgi:hypothetical protein